MPAAAMPHEAPLSPFWHAASRLSGRLDLSRLPPALEPTDAQLSAAGVGPAQLQRLRAGALLPQPGLHLLLGAPSYPLALRSLPFAPPVLYYRGELGLLQLPCAALVGSRRSTSQGQALAARLARALAEAGGAVVSGLAHGIDMAAHLAAPGRSVAVLGQDLHRPLPQAQARVAERILAEGGLLLSEFPPPTPPSPFTFPQRNRVISGLSRLVVVVEAAQRSGALITARAALEQGRGVMAVPGAPWMEQSQGCLDLLAEGAELCRGPDDLLQALGLHRPAQALPSDPLLRAMGQGASFDELMERLGWGAPELTVALSQAVLAGRVLCGLGERYSPRQ